MSTPEEIAKAYHDQGMQDDARLITELPDPRDYGGELFESANGWRWSIGQPYQQNRYWHDTAVWYHSQLQPYLDAEAAAQKEQALKDRIEWLVDICIPSYNSRGLEKDKPIRHPEHSGWWNGASVTDFEVLGNGDVRVQVKSYVGCSEYEDGEITLLKEWLEVDNPITVVQEWCVKEAARQLEIQKEHARQDTARRIANLQLELARLEKK